MGGSFFFATVPHPAVWASPGTQRQDTCELLKEKPVAAAAGERQRFVLVLKERRASLRPHPGYVAAQLERCLTPLARCLKVFHNSKKKVKRERGFNHATSDNVQKLLFDQNM